MKITKPELLALLRRFHIHEHHFSDMGPGAGLESVTLQGHVPLHQVNTLFEVLAHTDEPAWEPPPDDMIQAADAELQKLSDGGVIEYYLPTIPVGEEFVVGVKGQIIKLDVETVWMFLAGVTATAEFAARRAGIRF
jgi:hypothetical protein